MKNDNKVQYICTKQVPGAVAQQFPVGTVVTPYFENETVYYNGVVLGEKAFHQHFVPYTGSSIIDGFEPEATEEETQESLAIMQNNPEIEQCVLNVSKTGYEGMKKRCKEISLRLLAESLAKGE